MPEPRAPAWRIWYADGSSFSDLEGAPWASPAWGVLVIVQPNDLSGRYNQALSDFYIWRADPEWGGRWVGADFVGMLDYLAHNPGPCVVRFGRTVPNETFQAILDRAEADPEFPIRSAKHRSEIVGRT